MQVKQERLEVPTDGISKKAVKSGAFVYWGPEPKWEKLNLLLTEAERKSEIDNQIGHAFNWYASVMSSDDKLKDYLIKYVEQKFPGYVDAVKHVSEGDCHTMGAIARMLQRGAELPQSYLDKFEPWLKKYAVTVAPQADPQRVVIKQRDPKVTEFVGTIDRAIDEYFEFKKKKPLPESSMADVIFKSGATAAQKRASHEHFSGLICNLSLLIIAQNKREPDRDDDENYLVESYSNLPKKEAQNFFNWLTADASDGVVPAKKPRKTKAKKEKTPTQLLKLFVYQQSDKELKIESENPKGIIGADQLWVFNTQTRKLGVFYAKDSKGLSIYRRSIDNYDEARSVAKKVRKPEDVVPEIATMGKVPLRKALDNIRAVASPLKSRISEETLLVRIVK